MNKSERIAMLQAWLASDSDVARACVLALRSQGAYQLEQLSAPQVKAVYDICKVMIDELPVERLAWE